MLFILWCAAVVLCALLVYVVLTKFNLNPMHRVGDVVDTFNGVDVYFNGGVGQSVGRNRSEDGYNIGLKYQCVEFVKRYYYQKLGHKMPDAFGNAKDFFDPKIADGALNTQRALLQFHNASVWMPQVDDILVFSATTTNPYGHVAIISKVNAASIEIVQQNPGAFAQSRKVLFLRHTNDRWIVGDKRVLGWLRLPFGSLI